MEQLNLNTLFSLTKSSQMIYEKIPEQKIIKIYSLDENELVNGVLEFDINQTNQLSKKIHQKGLRFVSTADYFNEK